jgi:hypothetical protein
VTVERFCRSLPCPSQPRDGRNYCCKPIERHLGKSANVTEMTSQSGFGQTRLVSVLS